ncbi:MAG: hypothetical protein E6G35_12305 [Actinobacteria bacterium]|nr:MAG: hypothetical protein E6G35_12305 [Actinomycetota bacterium]
MRSPVRARSRRALSTTPAWSPDSPACSAGSRRIDGTCGSGPHRTGGGRYRLACAPPVPSVRHPAGRGGPADPRSRPGALTVPAYRRGHPRRSVAGRGGPGRGRGVRAVHRPPPGQLAGRDGHLPGGGLRRDVRLPALRRQAPPGAQLHLGPAGRRLPGRTPSRDELRTGPWTLCSGTDGRSTLLVGIQVGGGHPLAVPSAGTTGEALVLSTVDGDEYLVHDGKRHRIAHPETALAALGWSGRPPVRVAPALVNALPAGPDLAPVRVVGRGGPSGAAPGAKVGQLYTTGGHEYAVALADGAYDLTEVQAALLLADPAASGAPAIPLSTARYGALHRGTGGLGAPDGLPATPPTLVSPTGTVCATDRTVLLDPVLPDDADAPVDDDARVDRVLVRRGSGALVEAAPSPGAPPGSGTLSLVTDHGTRYPLAGPDLLAVLGYGGVTPVRVPADLVSLLPSGPALDPAAARAPLQGR